jgi:uncharacterized protein (TIGR03435 family)
VVDKTGLTESSYSTLEWAPDDSLDSIAPALVTGLREQLGRRLEARKNPVEVLVSDRIEKPSGN